MPPSSEREDGQVQFSVKELLDEINRKVDTIDEKLERKAERDRVHDISTRVAALELTAVKREGPVMQEIRDYERRLDGAVQQLHAFENGLGMRISKAIAEGNENAQKAADRSLSRREKLIMVGFGFVAAVGTLVTCAVLIIQISHHS